MLRFMRVPAAIIALGLLVLAAMHAGAVAPGNPAFQSRWERTDDPVISGRVSRTWIWGPEASTGVLTESYQESPGGTRQVQYYDKSRMEINNPNADPNNLFYVTNGLLVVELMTGNLQKGDNAFEPHNPAVVNVAGDSDDPNGPTYVTLAALRNLPPLPNGSVITQRVNRAGVVTNDPNLAAQQVTAAFRLTVPGIDHQIASPFWSFMNSSGLVKVDGQYVDEALFTNPFYATGFPITEAYWADVKVAGTTRLVLMQCFERRCLTFTPGNPAGFATEAGNVGLHYHTWRYIQIPGEGSPTATSTSTSVATATSTAGASTNYVYQMQFGRETDQSRAMVAPFAVAQDADSAVYVADFGANRVQKYNGNGEFVLQWGSAGTGNAQFDGPIDIKVGPDGNIYVVENGNNRVQVFDTDGGYLSTIGESGSGEGQFNQPTGIAFDSAGNIYVTDGANHRVQKFDSAGMFLDEWGQNGLLDGEFSTPSAIVVSSSDLVLVADLGNDRVQVFNTSGEFQSKFGTPGSGDGQLDDPWGILLSPDEELIVVSDTGNNRLAIFNGSAGWEGALGAPGAGQLQFNAPRKLAMIGELFAIADSGNSRIQFLNPTDGSFVTKIDGDSRGTFNSIDGLAMSPTGAFAIADYGANLVKRFNSLGSFDGQFGDIALAPDLPLDNPTDVAFDAAGLLYVADGDNDRIVVFDANGVQQSIIGSPGSGDGELDNPTGVSVAPNGNVYVADSNNDRVQVFDSTGQYLDQWGTPGTGNGQFLIPLGIHATATRVYVVDKGNSRVEVFEPDGDFLFAFGEAGSGNGQFGTVWRVTADAAGYIYVSSDNRVQKFTAEGDYLETIGTPGSGNGQLDQPLGIAVDGDGNLVVVDAGNSRVQVFAPVP